LIRSTTEPAGRSILIHVATRFLVAAYLIEAGLLITFAPWMQIWRHNAFIAAFPGLMVLGNPFVRGAVTGIGLVTLGAGIRDLVSLFFADRRPMTIPPSGDDRAL